MPIEILDNLLWQGSKHLHCVTALCSLFYPQPAGHPAAILWLSHSHEAGEICGCAVQDLVVGPAHVQQRLAVIASVRFEQIKILQGFLKKSKRLRYLYEFTEKTGAQFPQVRRQRIHHESWAGPRGASPCCGWHRLMMSLLSFDQNTAIEKLKANYAIILNPASTAADRKLAEAVRFD